jgi:ABC-type multidrug transport system fused ATPase/permease subunit
MKNFIKAIKIAKIDRKLLIYIILITLITVAVSSSLPLIQKKIFDIVEIQVRSGTNSVENTGFFNLIIIYAIICLFETIFNVIKGYLSEKWRVSSRNMMITQSFSHLNELSLNFFESNSTGKIKERVDKGVNDTLNVINGITIDILPQILYVLVAIYFLFSIHIVFGLIVLALLPIYIFIAIKYIKPLNTKQRRIRKLEEKASGVITESIVSIQTIKSFSAEERQLRKFVKLIEKILIKALERGKLRISMRFLQSNVIDIATVSVLGLGAYWTITGQISLGSLAMASSFASRAFGPISYIANTYDNIQRDSVSIELLSEFLNEKPKIADCVSPKSINDAKGNIELKNIRFGYNEKEVINDISLTIKQGQTVAFVGKSGSGKSTLTKLLLRFYDPKSGEILLDGINIKNIKKESLRNNIAVVIQDSQLFNDTVNMNIRFGKPRATNKEITEAAKIANANEFINALPKGYNTIVGERGVKLSGGEKQRINIARAILKNPSVLVFDEATSSLDSESEQLIQEALWKLIEGRTTIVIAHRLSTVMKADLIVVMDKGKIIESGTHDDLLKRQGIYNKLFEIQSGGYLK